MKTATLPSELVRVASLYFEGLDTPLALGLHIRMQYGLWDEISEVTPDPRVYLDSGSYIADAAAAGLLRKFQNLPTSHDRRANAVAKWREGERDCYLANERLARYLPQFANSADRNPVVSDILSLAKELITSWLGPRPDNLAVGRFGPGATYSDKGGRTTVPDKMSSDPTLTTGAIYFLPQWLGTQWGADVARRQGKIVFCPGNRFTTVPKTAKTDRSIAAEPSINVFYQLALGRQMRTRLKQNGWDLDEAQERHRQVAERSSVSREFATLDLSNASDTVCRNLVRVLMPPAWHDQLDGLRSPKTLIDGKWVVLEKFSSMGNGFTFELETVLFAALACVVSQKCGHAGKLGRDVFVFGDDIIVKDDVTRPLKSVLGFFGFTLNEEKSFSGGIPFRESCGGDYFAGKPVRPYFMKESPNDPQGYVSLANGFTAHFERLALSKRPVDRRAWFAVLDCVPSPVRRCRGPSALGDIVIHDDESRWQPRWRDSIRYLRALKPSGYRNVPFSRFRPEVVLACATYGTGNRDEGVIPRDGLLGYKVGWVPYS